MSDGKVGTVGWMDMTTTDAVRIGDFYADVVGFRVRATDMGGYEDFTLIAPDSGAAVAGVCHARGANAAFPRGWIPYFIVDNLNKSIDNCRALGGSIVVDVPAYGDGRYCVIQDPEGTPAALYQP